MASLPSTSSDRRSLALQRATLPALLLLSAVAMAFAVSSPEYKLLGWVTLLPVFQSIRVLSPPRAALGCGAWGAILFAACAFVFRTDVPVTIGSLAAMTMVPAAYGFVGARLTRSIGFSPYLLALGWMVVELALAPIGIRHGLLASTQDGSLFLGAVGSFSGYVLVAFIVAYINATLLSALHKVRRAMTGGRRYSIGSKAFHPLVFEEIGYSLLHLIRRAQPRAPPAC